MFTDSQHKRLTLALQENDPAELLHALPAINAGPAPSCVNCLHFQPEGELCGLAGQRPPARDIANGCPSWEFDDIPF